MRRTISRTVWGVVIACIVLTTASRSHTQSQSRDDSRRAQVQQEFDRTYPLAPTGRVSLHNINGAVRVTAWDRQEVRVQAVKRAFEAKLLDEAEIKIEASAEEIRIKTKYPTENLSFHSDGPKHYLNPASVDYTLTVPRGAKLDDFNLVNSALDIHGLTGEINASTVNGRVTAHALSGPRIKLSTVNGPLEAVFNRLADAQTIELACVNGPVTLTIPSDANAELRADTVHGNIASDFGLPIKRHHYVGRSLAGQVGRGGARLKVSNVNGPVTIQRAPDGKTLSPVSNLLSETRPEVEDIEQEVAREVERAMREVEKSVRSVELENRNVEKALREAERNMRNAEREARAAEREARAAAQEHAREAAAAAREIAREARRADGQPRTRTERIIVDGRTVSNKTVVIAGDDHDARHTAQESKTFATGNDVPRVRVETFEGNITVRAWDKPEVMFTAVKRAHDEKEMGGIKLRAEQRGAEIMIVANFDKSFSREVQIRNQRVVSFSSGASVSYEVYVPRQSAVRASSGDGQLRLEEVNGEVDLQTGDGPVEVRGGRGRVKVQTGDGRVQISDFNGEAFVQTGDGRITLDGRFVRLTAQTGDGAISLALPSDTNASIQTDAESVISDGFAVAEDDAAAQDESGRRSRRWRIGRGGGHVFTLHTGDGHIVLRQR